MSVDAVEYGHEDNVASQNCASKAWIMIMIMMRSKRVTVRSFEVAAASKWSSAGNGNSRTKTRASHQFPFDEKQIRNSQICPKTVTKSEDEKWVKPKKKKTNTIVFEKNNFKKSKLCQLFSCPEQLNR